MLRLVKLIVASLTVAVVLAILLNLLSFETHEQNFGPESAKCNDQTGGCDIRRNFISDGFKSSLWAKTVSGFNRFLRVLTGLNNRNSERYVVIVKEVSYSPELRYSMEKSMDVEFDNEQDALEYAKRLPPSSKWEIKHLLRNV